MVSFFKNYWDQIDSLVRSVDERLLSELAQLFVDCCSRDGTVYVVGNGGSAAIASHVAVDLTKSAEIRASTFDDTSLITCFSNDYGYEWWVKEALSKHCRPSDLVILISSSGESPNIINGARFCVEKCIPFVSLSGFSSNNSLAQEAANVSLWVDSEIYNFIENVHQMWLLAAIDFVREGRSGT